jgi:hypothetical protein
MAPRDMADAGIRMGLAVITEERRATEHTRFSSDRQITCPNVTTGESGEECSVFSLALRLLRVILEPPRGTVDCRGGRDTA